MLDRGMYYLPSDRREEGLVMVQNVRENVSLASLRFKNVFLQLVSATCGRKENGNEVSKKLDINPPNIERAFGTFFWGKSTKSLRLVRH